jgi:L-arabinokinase
VKRVRISEAAFLESDNQICNLKSAMSIVFYVSGHGFGHASRDIELIRTLIALRPDARIVVRSAVAARWFTELTARHRVELQTVDVDTGLAQLDSLRFDEEETARQAARFYADFEQRTEAEAVVLRQLGADLVVGDVPPLAFAAAARSGIPSIAVANFTWDWIYGIYPAFERLAPEAIPAIRRAYRSATYALRLPMHGGFEPMMAVTRDIPFIVRRSGRDRLETRRTLGIVPGRPAVLPSFGAYGIALPVDLLARSRRFQLIDPDRPLRDGFHYEDLVAAADIVVSKPGYGIVSECVANSTALLYTSRGRFAEYDLFVAEMPRVLRCRYLSREDLLAGHWDDAVDALVEQPAPPEQPRVDGAAVAAAFIVECARQGPFRQ